MLETQENMTTQESDHGFCISTPEFTVNMYFAKSDPDIPNSQFSITLKTEYLSFNVSDLNDEKYALGLHNRWLTLAESLILLSRVAHKVIPTGDNSTVKNDPELLYASPKTAVFHELGKIFKYKDQLVDVHLMINT